MQWGREAEFTLSSILMYASSEGFGEIDGMHSSELLAYAKIHWLICDY